ncbi:MAG: hypothetical protein MMC33_004100 [Icmadophila ericetorum]|nr:hypothetical protein [Icmadophila ericetorum]
MATKVLPPWLTKKKRECNCYVTYGLKACPCKMPKMVANMIPLCGHPHRLESDTSLCPVCFPQNLRATLAYITPMGPATIAQLHRRIFEKPRRKNYAHRRLVTTLDNIDEEPDNLVITDLRMSRWFGQRIKEDILAQGKMPTRVRKTRAKVYKEFVQEDCPEDAMSTTKEDAQRPFDVNQLVDLMARLTLTTKLHRPEPPQLPQSCRFYAPLRIPDLAFVEMLAEMDKID